jgi:sarcosine oxidase subunit gamma
MSEPATLPAVTPETPSAGAPRAIAIARLPEQGMIMLRADLGAAATKKAVKAAVGTAMPALRRIEAAGDRAAAWMSPDEVLLLLPRAEVDAALAAIAKALGTAHHLAADVSDARAVFALSDGPVRAVLAKLCPVDLSPDRLPPGEVRRTRLAQIACAFWFDAAGAATLVTFRSVAQYAQDLLELSADPAAVPPLPR